MTSKHIFIEIMITVIGTVSRDFQPLGFFTNQSHLGPDYRLKPFRIWLRIRRNNRHYLRCQWHRLNIRPDPHAVSLTPLKPPWSWNERYHRDFNHKKIFFCWILLKGFPRCQWHRWNGFSGVNDTAETAMRIRSKVSAVSMTPLKFGWHRWNIKTTLRVPTSF
jgi:hypothetical protein